jgi:predicted N-acyltransferase
LLSVHNTIAEIDPVQWNELAGHNAFATHDWLKTVEASCRVRLQTLYFTLAEGGRLVAASVCYVCPSTRDIETLDDLIFGRLASSFRALGMSYLPALVCGPLLGYGWHIGAHCSLSSVEAGEIRQRLLDAIAREADGRRLTLAFVHVLDEDRQLQSLLTTNGYLRCRNIPVASLDLKWPSFEAYLMSLPSKRRREFQRQTNRYREAGNELVCLGDPVAIESRLLQLLDANGVKRNGRAFACRAPFFASLANASVDVLRVFGSRKAGVLTATSVMLVRGNTAFLIAIGVDYEAAADDYSYFQITYNAPIAYAIETRVRRLYYGRGLDDVKVRRGCSLTESWIYVRPGGAIALAANRAWFPIASAWNRRKLTSEARQSLTN